MFINTYNRSGATAIPPDNKCGSCSIWWKRLAGEIEVLGESCLHTTLSTTRGPGLNWGRCDEKPGTNCHSYGTTFTVLNFIVSLRAPVVAFPARVFVPLFYMPHYSCSQWTPLNWVLLDKPLVAHLLTNFSKCCGRHNFITMFTRASHWSLSWAR
jgi:hypothetical protein